MKRSKVIDHPLAPFFILLVLTAVFVVIYTATANVRQPITYLKLLAVTPIPLALPLLATRRGAPCPSALNALFTVHIFCSVHLGTCLSFYSRISWWDLFLHGLFGALACALFLTLISRIPYAKSVCILSSLGLGAMWEIFEFITDLITGADAQGVISAIKNGKNPMSDTVTDLIITAVGAAVYLVFLYIFKKISEKTQKNAKKSQKGIDFY